MSTTDLEDTARALVADGKGILAADETVPTVTKRLAALKIDSTSDSRRDYREMFLTTPGIADFISGVIMQDETINQRSSRGVPMADVLTQQGILPGIKVDLGTKPLAGAPSERITGGLDRLRDRLMRYRGMGARFAKWRAVIAIGDAQPSEKCVQANAFALAYYAALCQEQGVVPIVEPEVLMNGAHDIERCEEVTAHVLRVVFEALLDGKVLLEGLLLKPNMVTSGDQCARQAAVQDVALATLRCLRRRVPAAVPGIVFLSGGQDHLRATTHLCAINQLEGPKPWKLSFSYGRALQDEALQAWRGKRENLTVGQRLFHHRAKCDSAAAMGRYAASMERESTVA